MHKKTTWHAFFIMLLYIYVFSEGALAQVSADSVSILKLHNEIQAASEKNNYPELARLFKVMISQGAHDTSTYYGEAIALAMSGQKEEGILYFDTAVQLGLTPGADGGGAALLLGINVDTNDLNLLNNADREATRTLKSCNGDINCDVRKLFLEDQSERQQLNAHPSPSLAILLSERDRKRRTDMDQLIVDSSRFNSKSFETAAVVYLHGTMTADYQHARKLALRSVQLGNKGARPVAALSLDRELVSEGKLQKYGTQFHFVNGKLEVYPYDPSTTDAERKSWGLPSISDATKNNDKIYGGIKF